MVKKKYVKDLRKFVRHQTTQTVERY